MMENRLFVTDLDNTLLYSYKHALPGDVCVETIHEKEQGFMSARTIRLLSQVLGKLPVIPVTTRSVEQYQRITFPEGTEPREAIVSNGAIRLKDGVRDSDWDDKMKEVIAPYTDETERLFHRYSEDPRFIRCRIVDAAYLFVYCAKGVDPGLCTKELADQTGMRVMLSGKKIYLLPPRLHKGTALQVLRESEPERTVIAAGDSLMDLDMLRIADYAIHPRSLELGERSGVSVTPDTDIRFSEFVLRSVLALCDP